MEYTDYDTRLASYAVVTDGDRVLLARLSWPDAELWTLPGGGVDFEETVEEGAVREVLEETGYDVVVEELLGVRSSTVPRERRRHENGRPMKAVQVVHRARVVGGELRHEAAGTTDMAEWVPIDDLGSYRHGVLVAQALRWAGLLAE
jgi:8-oxo-dGTP diphosphatase